MINVQENMYSPLVLMEKVLYGISVACVLNQIIEVQKVYDPVGLEYLEPMVCGYDYQQPHLLTWINFNPSRNK